MAGEPGGFGRAAPQHVGPHVEIVGPTPGSLRSSGEVDRGPHLDDVGGFGTIVGESIAVGLLGLDEGRPGVLDDRLLRRIRPLEGQRPAGRGRTSGRPLPLGPPTAGPPLREFVVVPVRHTHPL